VTLFVVVAAAMTAIALLLVLRPLLARRTTTDVERAGTNLAVIRDQLAELDADLRAGTLTEAQHRESKAELERRVLAEVKAERAAAKAPVAASSGGRRTALVAAVLVPLAAGALYWQLGSRDVFDPQKMAAAQAAGEQHQITDEQLEEMVGRLSKRLEQEPDNAQGWAILARSYYVMQRFPEAAAAYERLAKLAPGNADVLSDWADALAMAQNRNLAGRPAEIIAQALQADPNHLKTLALAGTLAFDRKDYTQAVELWERLLGKLPAESPMRQGIASSIAEARQLGGMKPPAEPLAKGPAAPLAQAPAAPLAKAPVAPAEATPFTATSGASIRGTVTIAPAIAAKASPNDTVFIFARAVDGPRMPLAIVRKQVKDLPATFSLDESMAMSPGMSLASFPRVVVGARVSKVANAAPQPGDLEGQSQPVDVGAANVAVVIDRILP
jgi:cytochrome c-type biogenesis protein CcmH